VSTYHHGDLRAALLGAAARILEKEGPEAISLRDLARRAEVSHNAPYRHFADRGALLAALAEEGRAQLARDLHGKPWREQAVAYVRFAVQNPERFRLMSGVAGLRSVIERSADPDAKAAALGTWALVHGLAQLILAGNFPDAEPETLVRETLAAVRFAAQRTA
jgi:AcrR family transcriptional regulator